MPNLYFTSYVLTRIISTLFSAATLIALILLMLVFLLQFIPHPKEITPKVPRQYHLIIKLEATTLDVLGPLRNTIPTRLKYRVLMKGRRINVDMEFSPLIAFVIILIGRVFLQGELWRVQEFARKKIKLRAPGGISEIARPLRAKPSAVGTSLQLKQSGQDQVFEGEGILLSSEQKSGGMKAKVSMRLTLLSEISKAKRLLEATKRYLAFLAVDVVKSTQMKEGEDEVAIGYSFMAYKKFVESILGKHGVWKQAWTPDGLMASFHSMGQAILAGQEILRRLEEFNQNHNQLKTAFSIRVGVHGGELYFDPSDKLEEVSDHVIDVAGHLQKEAEPSTLWTSLSDIEELDEKARFRKIDKKVDDHGVYEWRPSYSHVAAKNDPSAES